MKFLYIGQNSPGSTSGMRARILQELLNPSSFQLIDTAKPIQETPHFWRSIGYRLNFGPLISRINHLVTSQLSISYDFIWVDKGNFLTTKTTQILRSLTPLLVHFTPDCAFYSNRSRFFTISIPMYDWLISSKSFEREFYPAVQLIEITQGFDASLHHQNLPFDKKTREVCFIGLYEPSRGAVADLLLEAGIRVSLGGMGWIRYQNLRHPNLEFLGEKVFGNDYVEVINSSLFSLGLLSKKFPELHTTRTFEIPACGTALITERNAETSSFFNEDEAIFYSSFEELIEKVRYYKSHLSELESLTNKGHQKVIAGGYDYESILRKVLDKIL